MFKLSFHGHNPWTKSKRPSDTLVRLPAGTRYSALGIYSAEGADGLNEHDSEKSDARVVEPSAPILESSTAKRRHEGLTSNSSVLLFYWFYISTMFKLSFHSDNSWTKSKRSSDTLDVKLPAGTRYSALGIYSAEGGDGLNEHDSDKSDVEVVEPSAPILESSTAKRRHADLTLVWSWSFTGSIYRPCSNYPSGIKKPNLDSVSHRLGYHSDNPWTKSKRPSDTLNDCLLAPAWARDQCLLPIQVIRVIVFDELACCPLV